MKQTVSKELPLAEITLRKYERPSLNSDKRELVRKLCLSLGLLQPGDSRDVIVDVFLTLLNNKTEMSSDNVVKQVIETRKRYNLPVQGVAASNIRRQLKRLRELYMVEKVNNMYRITEFETLSNIFEQKIERFLLPSIIERVKDYLSVLK